MSEEAVQLNRKERTEARLGVAVLEGVTGVD